MLSGRGSNGAVLAMRDDAVIRVPRPSWERARAFALSAGRDLRVVTAAAMDEYVKRESAKVAKLRG